MGKILVFSIVATFLSVGAARGQDSQGMSTTDQSTVDDSGVRNEVVGIKPQVGALNFRDLNGDILNRGVAGMILDFNAAGLISHVVGAEYDRGSPFFIGPSTGILFSHIGALSSNFVGANPGDVNAGGDAGSNLFLIPADLKVGFNIGTVRLGVHGGGNVFYRSISNTIALGVNPDSSSESSWSLLPNAGLDLEWSPARHVALLLRPDLTFAGDNRVWAGTLGLSFPIG